MNERNPRRSSFRSAPSTHPGDVARVGNPREDARDEPQGAPGARLGPRTARGRCRRLGRDRASDAKKPGPLASLISQSKKESGLVVYGNPPSANFTALVQRFNYYYPWIKVTEYDLDDNTIFSKYASEAAQGVRTADLLIASAPNLWLYANRKHYVANFTPQDITKYPSWVKQYTGIYIMSPDPAIIVYNKLVLKDKVPQRSPTSRPTAAATGSSSGYTADNTFGFTALYGYVQKRLVEPRDDRQAAHAGERRRGAAAARSRRAARRRRS